MRALVASLMLTFAPAARAATLVLEVENVRSTEGQLLVAVFRGAPGFPGESTRAVLRTVARPVAPRTTVTFPDVPPGEYAAVVVHDTDSDGALRLGRVIPMPAEPLGCSRDAKGSFGPPRYEDARFVVPEAPEHRERFRLVQF
jgi:uncharacterized protein (DUF2141 family)